MIVAVGTEHLENPQAYNDVLEDAAVGAVVWFEHRDHEPFLVIAEDFDSKVKVVWSLLTGHTAHLQGADYAVVIQQVQVLPMSWGDGENLDA